jgi:short subunit dehydrogenase-like uncharacterized protein
MAVEHREHDRRDPTTPDGHRGDRVSRGLLLYGATGYTGRLVLDAALAAGLRPVLGGRDERRLAALAAPHGLTYRAAGLDDPGTLAGALDGIHTVLLAAGPFSRTAAPMIDACLHRGVHYLDITGEVLVLEAIAARHADAARRRVMLLPGVGFDVVPSDCLAAHVARRLPHASRLAIGVRGMELLTRGSAMTIVESLGAMSRVRRDGRIVDVTPGTLERSFDFGDGERPGACIGWGDVATAYYTTGIPNVEVYFEAIPAIRATLASTRWFGGLYATPLGRAWLTAGAELLPEGPTADERAAVTMVIVAEAEDGHGGRAVARLRTPEAYTLTAATATAIAGRVLSGDVEPGFQTPGRHFGPDFVLSLAGVTRQDLA